MDDREFEKVFWVIQPQLMRYAQTRLDVAAAEDAVSGTFVSLLRKKLPYPTSEGEERQLRALAYEVLAGHVRNEYRSRQRRHALLDRIGRLGHGRESTHDTTLEIVGRDTVDHWLGQLSVEDRQVILLYNAGLDIAETARVLGCTPAAAAKRRTRARNRLRIIVDKERGTT
ncbi:RNA polymerase sigma factor [Nocardioides hungaricus]